MGWDKLGWAALGGVMAMVVMLVAMLRFVQYE